MRRPPPVPGASRTVRRAAAALAALAALCLSAGLPAAQGVAPVRSAPSAPPPDFSAYRTVVTRNVFSAERRRAGSDYRPPVRRDPIVSASRPNPEYFDLVGTMLFGGRRMAFFSGSRAEFSTTLKTGDRIGGYRIDAVTPGGVQFSKDGTAPLLPVGRRMVQGESGTWTLAEIPAPAVESGYAPSSATSGRDYQSSRDSQSGRSGQFPGSDRSSFGRRGREDTASGGSAAPSSAAAPAAGGSTEDLLKQMMERRKKEMGQ